LITRDYASVLACPWDEVRSELWTRHTIAIGLRLPIKQLAVEGTRVTVSTMSHIYFFDTSTLPTPRLSALPVPPIRIYTILSTHPSAIGSSSCVQIHRSRIFYACHAGSDSTAFNPIPVPRHVHDVPERAKGGFERCIRSWDFSE
jgi:hypothetical protein